MKTSLIQIIPQIKWWPIKPSVYLYFALLIVLSCSASEVAPKDEETPKPPLEEEVLPPNEDPDAIKILFVGNSLTYVNDLPQELVNYAKTRDVNIATRMLAFPNFALEDHWNQGEMQDLITSNKYDYVVVQQGPSSQEDGRTSLLEFGQKIKTLCESNGSKLAFYMVWPAKVNYHTFDGVIRNYSGAAAATKSILCPVGSIWKEHFDTTEDYSYYGPDLFHPSLAGTKVAAEVIFNSLFRK
uniref:SGNH/GDSL hydrolase family protein n=1 Tax=Roseivirga sp. TaxID=1964215 RepID=UPI00404738B1